MNLEQIVFTLLAEQCCQTDIETRRQRTDETGFGHCRTPSRLVDIYVALESVSAFAGHHSAKRISLWLNVICPEGRTSAGRYHPSM